MKYETCGCDTGEAAVLTARAARANKVFHANSHKAVVILGNSPSPRKWNALVGTSGGWKVGSFNSSSMKEWHEAREEPRFIPETDKEVLRTGLAERGVAPESIDELLTMAGWYEMARPSWSDPLASPGMRTVPPEPVEPPKPREAYVPRASKVEVSDSIFKPPAVNPESYWYVSDRDAKLVGDYIDTRLAGHVTNLIITGPSGFGKTRGIIRQGKIRGVPVHVVNCQAITTPEKWLGQMMVDPERGTYFEVSQHIQWVERTHPDCEGSDYCILLYDEITRLRADLGNMTFSLLDDQQGLEVPQMNRRVHMSEKNVVIATANIGTPYTGAFQMDWALRGRFDVNLEVPLPPADEEAKILTSAFNISDEDAATLVRVANHTRTLWRNGELESPISTRSLVSWARFVGGGYSIKDAAEYTIVPLYTEDGGEESDRAKVKQALDGKVRS